MTASVFADHRATKFTTYDCEIEFVDRVMGGQPKDPKLVEGWLSKNMGLEDEDLRAQVRKHLTEMGVTIPIDASYEDIQQALEATAEESKTQGFKIDDAGRPCIEKRHIKAMLKESINIVFPRGTVKFGTYTSSSKTNAGRQVGGKDGKSYISERVFSEPNLMPVADEVSGVALSVGHIPDFRSETGTRSTIGYNEYVDNGRLAFEILSFEDCLTAEQWADIWVQAELNGLGALRSQGYGQFRVVRWERRA